MKINIRKHLLSVLILKAHVINVYSTAFYVEIGGISLFNNRGLHRHYTGKTLQPGITARENLRKLSQLPNRCDEGRNKKSEGDKIDVIHLTLHDEIPAGCDHDRRHDAHEKFLIGIEHPHRTIEILLCRFILIVSTIKTRLLYRFIGKGLRRLNAGNT